MTVCGIKHADGVCVMGKCPYFKKCCPHYWLERKSESMTEEEWLRTATTEQLAEWIVHLADQCTISHECNLCESWCDEKRVVEWLKQPHKESE